jgi:hypothetical protein
MNRADRRPSVWPPIIVSLLALTALNIVLANWIAGQVSPQAGSLPAPIPRVLLALAILFVALAFVLWRRYTRPA